MFDQGDEGRRADGPGPVPPAGRVRWEFEPTGPVTIAGLAEVSLAGLSAAELLDLVIGWERQAGWLAACQVRVIAAAAAAIRVSEDGDPADPVLTENLVAAEIGTALRLSPTTAGGRVAVAEDLTERLPATAAALREGRISYWQAVVLAKGTSGLTGEQARLIEERVLPTAANTTAAGLRKRVERARLILNPRDTSERAEEALEARTVTLIPGEDADGRVTRLRPGTTTTSVVAGAGPGGRPDLEI